MGLTMYDAVELGNIPPNPAAVAGYVNGKWPTFQALRPRWPRAHLLSISVHADEPADCLDVEAGDAQPASAATWIRDQQELGTVRPILYASVGAMGGLLRLIAAAGIPRGSFRIWTAHYTGRAHLCGPECAPDFHDRAGATQWTDQGMGRALDVSEVVGPGWFPHGRG